MLRFQPTNGINNRGCCHTNFCLLTNRPPTSPARRQGRRIAERSSMSNNGPISCRTIEDVDLPAPATKLTITQHLAASQDSPFWAWIIVGAFYDRHGNTLWSTKIFLGCLGVDTDSDDETTDSEGSVSVTESEAEEATGTSNIHLPYRPSPFGSDNAFAYQYHNQTLQAQQFYPHWNQTLAYNAPPVWDPARQGQVPGYWNASFDPQVRRWVHTWQPLN
jgi:hypothetical protein